MKLILASFIILFSTCVSASKGADGLMLLEQCESDDMDSYSFCENLLLGFYSGYTWKQTLMGLVLEANKLDSDLGRNVCEPSRAELNGRHLRRIYIKWANDNPKDLSKYWSVAVLTMLVDTYPCGET